MRKLTLAEQELHIWINGAEPNVVNVDVSLPKYRRHLERLGMTPLETDEFGGARFIIPVASFRGFGRGKRKTSADLKARRAETLRRNTRSRRGVSTVVDNPAANAGPDGPRHPQQDLTDGNLDFVGGLR